MLCVRKGNIRHANLKVTRVNRHAILNLVSVLVFMREGSLHPRFRVNLFLKFPTLIKSYMKRYNRLNQNQNILILSVPVFVRNTELAQTNKMA